MIAAQLGPTPPVSPHESPQYNMLLGTVGEFTTGPSPGLARDTLAAEMQCAECHMQTTQ